MVRPGSSEAANVAWGLGSLMAAGGFMDEAERLAREVGAREVLGSNPAPGSAVVG